MALFTFSGLYLFPFYIITFQRKDNEIYNKLQETEASYYRKSNIYTNWISFHFPRH
jgi:hypothetical protein